MFHAFVLRCLISAHKVTIFFQLLSAFPFNLRKAGENDFSKNSLSAILDIDTFRRIHHSTAAEVIDGVILFLLAGYSLLDSC